MTEWDERYAEPGYAYGTEPNEFLVSVAHEIPEGEVLCLAEGEGRNAVWLAQRGHDVVAIDRSRVGLQKAEALARERGVSLTTVPADLATVTMGSGVWAGIVAIFMHLPPAVRAAVHRSVVQGLRPGGVYVLEAYAPRQLERGTGGPRAPELLVPLDDVRAELDGLDLLIAREMERDVTEGRFHHGHAVVVQILARKPIAPPLPG